MKILSSALLFSLVCLSAPLCAVDEITPHKFSSADLEKNTFSHYRVPQSSKFSIPQHQENDPNITFYMSKPKHKNKFPIVILCGGSSTEKSINSIIHLHRYFLQEFLDLGVGLITVEQRGVSDDKVNPSQFIQNTTQQLRDFLIIKLSLIIS